MIGECRIIVKMAFSEGHGANMMHEESQMRTRRLLIWGMGVPAILWPPRIAHTVQSEILVILSCKLLVCLEIVRCWVSRVTCWVKTEVDGHLMTRVCQGSWCEVALCWVIWVSVWGLGTDFWPLDPLRCLGQHTAPICTTVGCDLTVTPVSPQ